MTAAPAARVSAERALLLLVDVQVAYLETMAGLRKRMFDRLCALAAVARLHDLPAVATLERPLHYKGRLPVPLRQALPESAVVLEKSYFDCFASPVIAARIKKARRRQLIVAGCETDVCILQTVLSALAEGYQVFVVEDCLFSASADCSAALRRMREAGAVGLTYKTLFYELQRRVFEDLPAAARRARRQAAPPLVVP